MLMLMVRLLTDTGSGCHIDLYCCSDGLRDLADWRMARITVSAQSTATNSGSDWPVFIRQGDRVMLGDNLMKKVLNAWNSRRKNGIKDSADMSISADLVLALVMALCSNERETVWIWMLFVGNRSTTVRLLKAMHLRVIWKQTNRCRYWKVILS